MNNFKEFLASSAQVQEMYDKFLEQQKESCAKKAGQYARILNGKNKNVTGQVEFIGLTRYDRMAKSEEPSVCLKHPVTGEKYWTKQHNTRIVLDVA